MMAKLESKHERTVSLSEIAPTRAAKYLCSRCLRPYHGEDAITYYCEACGAAHYEDEFYICCPVDEKHPLE